MSAQNENPGLRELTKGEALVRVSFNPSNLSLVDETKQAFADIADKMYEQQDIAFKQSGLPEQGNYTINAAREFSMAISDIQKTCMMAVAALTNVKR